MDLDWSTATVWEPTGIVGARHARGASAARRAAALPTGTAATDDAATWATGSATETGDDLSFDAVLQRVAMVLADDPYPEIMRTEPRGAGTSRFAAADAGSLTGTPATTAPADTAPADTDATTATDPVEASDTGAGPAPRRQRGRHASTERPGTPGTPATAPAVSTALTAWDSHAGISGSASCDPNHRAAHRRSADSGAGDGAVANRSAADRPATDRPATGRSGADAASIAGSQAASHAAPSPAVPDAPARTTAPVPPPVRVEPTVSSRTRGTLAAGRPAPAASRMPALAHASSLADRLLGAGLAPEEVERLAAGIANGRRFGEVLIDVFCRLPAPPDPPHGPGSLLAVVGPLHQAVADATRLAAELGLVAGDVAAIAPPSADSVTRAPISAVSSAPARGRRAGAAPSRTGSAIVPTDNPAAVRPSQCDPGLQEIDAAARWIAARRDRTSTVVVIDAGFDSRSRSWAAHALAMIRPDAVWGTVDALAKPEDIAAWATAIGGVDALMVGNVDATVSPASVLRTGLPVARLDGRPASPERWAATIGDLVAA